MYKPSCLYVMNLDGKLYWGSYMNATFMGISYEWVMRREPMKQNKWYGNSVHQVYFEPFVGQFGDRQFLISHRTKGTSRGWVTTMSVIRCAENTYAIAHSGQRYIDVKPVVQGRSLVGCFKNRLNEYHNSYLIPLSKGHPLVLRYLGLEKKHVA